MTTDASPVPPQHSRPRLPAQVWLSALAAWVLLILLAGTLALGIFRWSHEGLERAKAILTLSAVLAATIGVLLTSAFLASHPNLEQPPWRRLLRVALHPWLLFLLTPPAIAVGAWLQRQNTALWLLFPVVHVLAVGLPLLWFLRTGLKGLLRGTPARIWGAFSVGLVLTPPLTFIAEILTLLAAVLLLFMALLVNPVWRDAFDLLGRRLMFAPSPGVAQRILASYLREPALLYGVLVLTAGLVPLIEETLKPLAVWRLLGEHASPREGFVLGALCGAGFAFYETLTTALLPDIWLTAVLARIGTGWLHITTAALTGYGMVYAWRERRYDRLGLAYGSAVALHALWNGVTILATLSSAVPALRPFQVIAPLVLSGLTLGMLLWWWNARRALAHLCYNEPTPNPVEAS